MTKTKNKVVSDYTTNDETIVGCPSDVGERSFNVIDKRDLRTKGCPDMFCNIVVTAYVKVKREGKYVHDLFISGLTKKEAYDLFNELGKHIKKVSIEEGVPMEFTEATL